MTRNDQNVSVLDSVLPYLAGDGGEVGALLLEYLNTRRGVPAATEARSSRRVVAAAAQARTFLAEKLTKINGEGTKKNGEGTKKNGGKQIKTEKKRRKTRKYGEERRNKGGRRGNTEK